MLPELAQRCQLAHCLIVMRDVSELLAWLLVGRDLRKIMNISIEQSVATEIKMHIMHCSLSLCQSALKLNLLKMCPCLYNKLWNTMKMENLITKINSPLSVILKSDLLIKISK